MLLYPRRSLFSDSASVEEGWPWPWVNPRLNQDINRQPPPTDDPSPPPCLLAAVQASLLTVISRGGRYQGVIQKRLAACLPFFFWRPPEWFSGVTRKRITKLDVWDGNVLSFLCADYENPVSIKTELCYCRWVLLNRDTRGMISFMTASPNSTCICFYTFLPDWGRRTSICLVRRHELDGARHLFLRQRFVTLCCTKSTSVCC